MITILHHPRCSKSREALTITQAFTQSHQLPLTIVEYQKAPLSLAELTTLQQQLGCQVADMVRSNEEEFGTLELAGASDSDLLATLAQHPALLQRPIVVFGETAMIARPPADLAHWLHAQVSK